MHGSLGTGTSVRSESEYQRAGHSGPAGRWTGFIGVFLDDDGGGDAKLTDDAEWITQVWAGGQAEGVASRQPY